MSKPNNQFRDFYYSSDNFLLWVAGYTANNNTDSVNEIILSLRQNAQKFADFVGCKFEQVQTCYNTCPPRFQYMQVFYIKTEAPHPDAFVSTRTFWEILTS